MVFSHIKDYLKRTKRKIKITFSWPGDGKLGKPRPKDKPITQEEIWRELIKRRKK